MTKLKIKKTIRGFNIYNFKDKYGAECSLQESSIATEYCIWLGADECENCGETNRMHLTQDMAKDLILLLTRFVETGNIQRGRKANDKKICT